MSFVTEKVLFRFWFLIECIVLLNSCEDFVLFNSQSTLTGYSLLTISQLNDPGIRALLIQTYNDLGGLRAAGSWTTGNTCFSTSSTIGNGNIFLSIGGTQQTVFGNGANSDGVFNTGEIYQFRIGDTGSIRTTLNDLTTWTVLTCVSFDKNPGIFGKNCGINNQQTIIQPGVYSYTYSSNEAPGTYSSNRAKYRIRFTISGFTCYAPTITVKTFMGDYGNPSNINADAEEILTTYIFDVNDVSSIVEVDRCGDTNDFCDSTSRPGSSCNIAGIQGTGCSRYVSCPQYYTPVNSWSSGSIREFIVSNGAEVHDLSDNNCGTDTMNIEFILSCATELVQINNGNSAYTTTYSSGDNGAEYYVAYLLQSSCVNPRITLRTQIGDYNDITDETISLIYDSANPLTIKTCGYQNDLFCQPNGGDCNIAINDNKCYLGASCPYEYQGTTLPSNTYQLLSVQNGAAVTAGLGCSDGMNIQLTIACGSASTPNVPTFAPTESPVLPPTRSPIKAPTKTPSLNPSISPTKSPTTTPTKTPSQNPTKTPTATPTTTPSVSPSITPSKSPSQPPTVSPSKSPSFTQNPTVTPSLTPTNNPSDSPSKMPSLYPSENPTVTPTKVPTLSPIKAPTKAPLFEPVSGGFLSTLNKAQQQYILIALVVGGIGCCIICLLCVIYFGIKNKRTKEELRRANNTILTMNSSGSTTLPNTGLMKIASQSHISSKTTTVSPIKKYRF